KERDAALARVAELKTMSHNYCALLMDANTKLAELEKKESAQAQHSVPITPELKRALGLVVAALEADGDRPTLKYALSKLKKVIAAAPGKEVGHE
uniref:hypothetical protein n=1 Tax=Pseudomonas aeruginosa TaxID=287 RepID=UPI0019692E99